MFWHKKKTLSDIVVVYMYVDSNFLYYTVHFASQQNFKQLRLLKSASFYDYQCERKKNSINLLR
uniref:Ovule protein n=1 Tax=Romanomermis culicivorax TaxID=13658 RepID=A0A915J173_ROMCU